MTIGGMYSSYTPTDPTSVTLITGNSHCASLVDGDYSTAYSGVYSYKNREYGMDLGAETNVTKLRFAAKCYYEATTPLVWLDNFDEMSVWYSNDNSSWTHIMDLEGASDCPLVTVDSRVGYFDIVLPAPVSARYFKIHCVTMLQYGGGGSMLNVTEVEAAFPLTFIAHMEGGAVLSRARLGVPRNFEAHMEAGSAMSRPILGLYFQACMEAGSALGRAHLAPNFIAHFEGMSAARRAASAVRRDLAAHMEALSAEDFNPTVFITILRRLITPLGNNLHHVLCQPFGRTKLMTMLQSLGVSAQTRRRFIQALSGDGAGWRKRLIQELAAKDDVILRMVLKTVLESGEGVIIQLGPASGGEFIVGDVVTGGQSGAEGVITDLGAGWIDVAVTSGAFSLKETISNGGAVTAETTALGQRTGNAILRQVYYNIYLDGIRVTDRLTGASVDYSQNSTHNQVTLESCDEWLYHRSKPDGSAASRITVQVGSRELYFLIEERSGDEQGFTITGRSLTAMEDDLYKEAETWRYDNPTLASSIAEDMAGGRPLDWLAVDWAVPGGFEFEGTGVQGIIKLAEEVGAVVRSNDAGEFVVRPKFPVRPVHLPAADPDVSFDREESLLELSYTEKPGTGHNAITVYGYSPNTSAPDVEVEEPEDGTRDVGDTAYVRVYWPAEPPEDQPKGTKRYLTDGKLTDQPVQAEREIEEIIEFHDGTASASKPVQELLSFEWLGEEPDVVDDTKYIHVAGSKEFSLKGVVEELIATQYKVARIKYKTRYWRYEVREASVDRVILALEIPKAFDTTVRAVIDDGDKELEDIEAPLLTTQEAALARAMMELDSVRYPENRLTIGTPYDNQAIDGNIAHLDDGRLSLYGNALIVGAKITFDGPMVTQELELVNYEI